MKQLGYILLVWLWAVTVGLAADKFSVSAKLDTKAVPAHVVIDFKIAHGAYIYADSVAVLNGTNRM